ncbi:MAG: hypothetical protein IKZ82_13320 [Clostridia bacterium]|nr:hypothetical protein [Clostridia bacterium]
MKKFKTTLAFALALILCAVSALPAFAAVRAEILPAWIVPSGYNAHDYGKCAAFFEITDGNGLKNGNRMSDGYDPSDPSTWISIDMFGDIFEHVIWEEHDGELRLKRIDVAYLDAVGTLDLSGCPYLTYIEATDDCLDAINTHNCPELRELYCDNNGLGTIDVSENPLLYKLWCDGNGLTEIDISNNPALYTLDCNNNLLTSLDLSNHPALGELYCADNLLTELDVSENTELTWLWCPGNMLTELDVSANTKLRKVFAADNALTEINLGDNTLLNLLDCMNNRIASLDVSANTALKELDGAGNTFTYLKLNSLLGLDTVRAEGDGSFSYHYSVPYSEGFLSASANEGSVFVGWYDENGEFITASPYITIWNTAYTELTARFTTSSPVLLGDADGSGYVNMADAVLTLRYAMGLIDASGINLINADVNNDGGVNMADAVAILRAAMGL